MMQTMDERRDEPRIRKDDIVRLEWTDASYVTLSCQGQCLDISRSGMKVAVAKPLPEKQYVRFEVVGEDLRGSGVVKFSRDEEGQHVAGIRFAWQMRRNAA